MFSVGNSLHFINLMFKSTAYLAKMRSSMNAFKSILMTFFLCDNLCSLGANSILERSKSYSSEVLKE